MDQEKDIIVTGAYGGMGRAAVLMLRNFGYRIFALDRTVGEPEENIVPIRVDVASEASVKSAYEVVRGYTDTLYGVIHFAGIYKMDSLIEMDSQDFQRIFDVNLFGVFYINKTFSPLLKQGSRVLITTSELAPLDPLPFTGIYAVTKGALDKYAYSLRMELQLLGIKVSVLRAGAVDTGMLGASTDALDRFCEKTEHYVCNADRFRTIVNKVEARRIHPEKLAKKVVRILKKRNPSFVYSINRNPLLLLLNCLPKRMQLRAIRLVLR